MMKDNPQGSDQYLREHTIGELKPLSGPVRIVEYDPAWPGQFERAAQAIRSALGAQALRVEHVGSTSVPGLCAKPVIDIVLVVADSAHEGQYAAALGEAGYQLHIREPGWYEHRVFHDAQDTINLHVFSAGCPEVDRMLAFRDRLRASVADRELYAQAKRTLAQQHWKYTQNYADAKTSVIQEILSRPQRIGILAGSFNPPTIAHVELLRAGAAVVDQLRCVVPTKFPHKEYAGATLEQRLQMLRQAADELQVPCSIVPSDYGLFIDIARECRQQFDPSAQFSLLCGADAAERILNWDYGRPGVVEEMLEEFDLLVAPRGTAHQPLHHIAHRVRALDLSGPFHDVSSTEVRERIRRGEAWEHLVPASIVGMVREIYS